MATDFIACSKTAAQWLYGDKIPREMIQVIPYAIELGEYKYNENIRKSIEGIENK